MSTRRKLVYAFAILAAVAFVFSFFAQPKKAPDRASMTYLSSDYAPSAAPQTVVGGLVRTSAPMEAKVAKQSSESSTLEPKVIRNAELTLVVNDVRDSAAQIVRMVTAGRGQVDSLNIAETREGCFSGTLVVRVPSSGLEDAVAQFKGVALRTAHEQISARDVTHEFYDNEAHLRNLHAEEQQYLEIMKRSGKIADTLEVAERLSDVRDRIERQQAAMQVMSHDIEMSQVSINLSKQVDTKIAGFEWRPLQNARAATRDMLVGLGEWFDSMVSIIVKLPLLAIWLLTIGGILWLVFLVCRSMWRRFRHLLPADSTEAPSRS